MSDIDKLLKSLQFGQILSFFNSLKVEVVNEINSTLKVLSEMPLIYVEQKIIKTENLYKYNKYACKFLQINIFQSITKGRGERNQKIFLHKIKT